MKILFYAMMMISSLISSFTVTSKAGKIIHLSAKDSANHEVQGTRCNG